MAEKILNTRIALKIDTLENWQKSTLGLKKGELAIATVAASAGTGLTEPVCMIKIGEDGVKTFSQLEWNVYAKASDVLSACKTEDGLKAFVNGVIADAGIASNDAMEALAGRVTTAEGKVTTLEGKMTTVEGKVSANEEAIETIEGRFGAETVALEINAAINALNLATTYAAKVHTHEIADVNGLSDSIAAAKKAGTDANAALEAYKTLNDAAVKVNSDAIAGIKNGETLDSFKEVEEALAGKQAAGNYSVEGHKHEIADVNGLSDAIADAKKAGTDASAAAGQALTDAKAYTDSEMTRLVGDTKVADQITTAITNLDLANTYDAKGAAAAAETAAKGHADGLNTAMNARVEALEAIDHDHTNKTVLDGITAEKVAAWDAAEQNAKDYADGLDEAMDERVAALENKFTGEGSVEAQINAAVAAEAEIARAAEQANAKAVTDLTNGAVKDNADAIDALETLVGETAVAEQIENALKVEVDGAKVEKYALATALAAEAEAARAAEKANADAIEVLNGNAETEGSVDYKVAQAVAAIMENPDETMNSINELVTWVNGHAEDALAMSNQVAANKTALETLNGDATKAGSVDKKIADAIAAENLGQYATDGELSALAGRVTTIETEHNTESTGLKARLTAAEADIDALELLVGDDTVSKQITDVIDPLTARVVELEKVDHSHANAAELNKIADGDKAKWDAKLENVTAAADSGLKATKSGNAVAIEIDDSITWVFDCGDSGATA